MNNLLRDYVEGRLDDYAVLFRALVVEVDHVGGKLENNPPNPRNSLRVRVVTNDRDKDVEKDNLPVVWPMFSHDTMPVKEGEHVYVLFEDSADKAHGLWISRIPEPGDVENKNLTPGILKYQKNPDNNLSSVGEQKVAQGTDFDPGTPQTSNDFTSETVPMFKARVGDRVIEGSNNTTIILSRDRISDPSSGEKNGAGTIDLVAGRSGEDIDLSGDKSRIYISMQTDVDNNFSIDVGPKASKSASIVVKSDEVRVVARNGMKLVVEGGDITVDANTIILGKDASEAAVLGNKLVTELGKIIDAIAATPPIGQLGQVPVPLNPAIAAKLNQIKAALQQNILSKKNKVK